MLVVKPARRSRLPSLAWAGLARGVLCGLMSLCACLGIFLGGCGGEDAGSSPYAGTVRAVGPGAAYSFRYLSPPWAAIPVTTGLYAVLDWNAAGHIDITHLPSLDSLSVVLRVESLTGSAEGALQTRTATLSSAQHSSSRELATAAGIHGREISWTESGSNRRHYN